MGTKLKHLSQLFTLCAAGLSLGSGYALYAAESQDYIELDTDDGAGGADINQALGLSAANNKKSAALDMPEEAGPSGKVASQPKVSASHKKPAVPNAAAKPKEALAPAKTQAAFVPMDSKQYLSNILNDLCLPDDAFVKQSLKSVRDLTLSNAERALDSYTDTGMPYAIDASLPKNREFAQEIKGTLRSKFANDYEPLLLNMANRGSFDGEQLSVDKKPLEKQKSEIQKHLIELSEFVNEKLILHVKDQVLGRNKGRSPEEIKSLVMTELRAFFDGKATYPRAEKDSRDIQFRLASIIEAATEKKHPRTGKLLQQSLPCVGVPGKIEGIARASLPVKAIAESVTPPAENTAPAKEEPVKVAPAKKAGNENVVKLQAKANLDEATVRSMFPTAFKEERALAHDDTQPAIVPNTPDANDRVIPVSDNTKSIEAPKVRENLFEPGALPPLPEAPSANSVGGVFATKQERSRSAPIVVAAKPVEKVNEIKFTLAPTSAIDLGVSVPSYETTEDVIKRLQRTFDERLKSSASAN